MPVENIIEEYIKAHPGSEKLHKRAEKIFAANAPALLEEPIKTEKGWVIVKVNNKESRRQKAFDEVQQQVMMMLSNQKRQDVQQDYIRQMMDKYNVIIHTSALAPSKETKPESDISSSQK